MNLFELFSHPSKNVIDLLFEDFGNLKQIDKKFLKHIKVSYKQKEMLSTIIGKNSTITEHPDRNLTSNKLTSILQDKLVAGVIVVNEDTDEQVGLIIKIAYDVEAKNFIGFKASTYLTMIDFNIIDPGARELPAGNIVVDTTDSLYSFFGDVFSFRGKSNYKLMIILLDKARNSLQWERNARQKGLDAIHITPGKEGTFAEKAKESLAKRLHDFKNQKRSFSIRDAVDEIKAKGYLDTIVVDGYEYEYHTSIANFDLLRKPNPNNSFDKSYVRYRIANDDFDRDSRYGKAWTEYMNLMHKHAYPLKQIHGDDYSKTDEYQDLKAKLIRRAKLPPSSITFLLKMEGGVITPYDVKLEYS